MKIYQVKPDSNNVQWVLPNVIEEKLSDIYPFDCIAKEKQLDNVTWYIHNIKNKRGNFYTGISGALVFDQMVFDSELFTLFEMAGEILPVQLEGGEKLYVLNVLECINILNKENTIYDLYDDGTKGRILNYSFHENRISESTIFKIPETSRAEVLTYTGIHDTMDEFLNLYKELKFTGLIFKEIYNSES